jgi:hypothetical protein
MFMGVFLSKIGQEKPEWQLADDFADQDVLIADWEYYKSNKYKESRMTDVGAGGLGAE